MRINWTTKTLLLTLLFVAVFFIVIGSLIYFFKKEQQEQVIIPEPTQEAQSVIRQIIGSSVEQRAIEVAIFGDGKRDVLFVGGVHGGYEYNSVVLAEQLIVYFTEYPEVIPEDMTLHIIPSLNPDGVADVVDDSVNLLVQSTIPGGTADGTGRFNANGVDLNRNFDCKWQPESTWKGNIVSAGTAPFSEPEAQALRDYVFGISPEAVVFWHSKANNVYASECENGVLPKTLTLMNSYAQAAGYGAVASFDAYPVTGDAEGWLASIGIPAITVELSSHQTVEFEKNVAGVKAMLGVL